MYGSVSSLENPISLFSLTKEDNTLMHLAPPMLQIYKQFVFIFHFTTVHCCILNLSTDFPFLFLIFYFSLFYFPTLLANILSIILRFFLRPYLPFLQFCFRAKCHLKKFCGDIFTAYPHQIVLSIFL